MTRNLWKCWLLLACFFGGTSAQAQVYVRPSKGAPIIAVSYNTSTQVCIPASCSSVAYDFSSFDALQVLVRDADTSAIIEGPWLLKNIALFARFNYGPIATSNPTITLQVAATKSGTFSNSFEVGAAHTLANVIDSATNVDVIVTGIPFSSTVSAVGASPEWTPYGLGSKTAYGLNPAPVLLGGLGNGRVAGTRTARAVGVNGKYGDDPTAANSGTVGYGVALNSHITGYGPNQYAVNAGLCQNSVESLTILQSNASSATPASPLASRRSILLCNSAENAGTPLIKCRDDGALPVMGLLAGQSGITLNKSDCVTYYVSGTWTDGGSSIHCITDTPDAGLIGNECL